MACGSVHCLRGPLLQEQSLVRKTAKGTPGGPPGHLLLYSTVVMGLHSLALQQQMAWGNTCNMLPQAKQALFSPRPSRRENHVVMTGQGQQGRV
jgi:hypothetical protein